MTLDDPNTVYLCAFDSKKHLACLSSFEQLLCAEEKKILETFSDSGRMTTFVLGHGLVHQALGLVLNQVPKDIVLSRDAVGKWFVPDQPWHFNLSHSGNWLCLAMSLAGQVGVDIECLSKKRAWENVANKYFSSSELATFYDIAPDQQPVYAASRWVYREAWLKAHGLGVGALRQVIMEDSDVQCNATSIDDQVVVSIVVQSQQKLFFQWVMPSVFLG